MVGRAGVAAHSSGQSEESGDRDSGQRVLFPLTCNRSTDHAAPNRKQYSPDIKAQSGGPGRLRKAERLWGGEGVFAIRKGRISIVLC